jgi:hypothetical protein
MLWTYQRLLLTYARNLPARSHEYHALADPPAIEFS